MEKTQIGNTLYTNLGNSSSPLLLKSNGNIKLQWGNSLVDLIKDGKVASNNDLTIKLISSANEIIKDGIYICNDKIIITNNGNNYEIIIYKEQEDIKLDSKLKSELLRKQGLVAKTKEDVDLYSGFVFIESENKIYKVLGGKLFEQSSNAIENENNSEKTSASDVKIPNVLNFDSNFIIKLNDDNVLRVFSDQIYFPNQLYINNKLFAENINDKIKLYADSIINKSEQKEQASLDNNNYAIYSSLYNEIIESDGNEYELLYENLFKSDDKVLILYVNAPIISAKFVQEPVYNYFVTLEGDVDIYNKIQVLFDDDEFILDNYTLYKYLNPENNTFLLLSEFSDTTLKYKSDSFIQEPAEGFDPNLKEITLSNYNSDIKFPIIFINGTRIEQPENFINGEDVVQEINSEENLDSFTIDNLESEYKRYFRKTIQREIDTISSFSNRSISFNKLNVPINNGFVYLINKNYINIENGELDLKLNDEIKFKLGNYNYNNITYNSYSKSQLINSPTLNDSKIIGTCIYETLPNVMSETNIVNVKYVKTLVDSEIKNSKYINDIKEDVKSIKSDISTINDSIITLQSKNEEFTEQVQSLQDKDLEILNTISNNLQVVNSEFENINNLIVDINDVKILAINSEIEKITKQLESLNQLIIDLQNEIKKLLEPTVEK